MTRESLPLKLALSPYTVLYKLCFVSGESLKEGAETYSIRGLQCSLNNSLSRNPSHHGGYAAAPSHSALGLNLEMISSRTILQQQLPYHNTNYQVRGRSSKVFNFRVSDCKEVLNT